MRRSRQQFGMIGREHSALQHEHAPRPLPLFLELLREVGAREPELAREALAGLALYSAAPRLPYRSEHPQIAQIAGASLRDHGGAGPPIIVIPSLINPPHIVNLDEEVSLMRAIADFGHRALLVDWGEAGQRLDLSVGGHIENLLMPLLATIGERPILLGYCLGGTMAIAAANLTAARAVITLATPWNFSRYPQDGRAALQRLWQASRAGSDALGVLPVEVLQASFWSLDPHRTVSKYAELNRLDPEGAEFRRFVALEDWANEGQPLPLPAARELIEDFFGDDRPGGERWEVGGRTITAGVTCPRLHFTAARDRITPAETAPPGTMAELPAGHVGMVVGRTRHLLHEQLGAFLASCR